MVTHVDVNGFIRFTPVGECQACTLVSQSVVVHGRQRLNGVMVPRTAAALRSGEDQKAPDMRDLYMDTGLSREHVAALVEAGDIASLDQDFRFLAH